MSLSARPLTNVLGNCLESPLSTGAIFTPLDIPGLVAWWDAPDPSTITESASKISQWDGKSGGGNNLTQGTGANQPTYDLTGGPLGSPTIDFGGSPEFLTGNNPTDLQITGDFTIFAVVEGAGKAQRILSKDDGGLRSYFLRTDTTSGAPEMGIFQSGVPSISEATTDISGGGWHIIAAVNDGTDMPITIDGTEENAGTGLGGSVDNDAADFEIGRFQGGGGAEYWTGEQSEIIIYNVSLSSAQQTTVTQYLAGKYGISI